MMRFFIYFFIPTLIFSCCFFIQTKDSRLVLLVHSFPPKYLFWTPIPFKLLFDANMARFSRIDVTKDDILFNDTSFKPKLMLHPNKILGVTQYKRVLFSYLRKYGHVALLVILWLTLQWRHVPFNFHIFPSNPMSSLSYICSNLWFFIHVKFLGTFNKAYHGESKHILVF
jgi:hypothetical protein